MSRKVLIASVTLCPSRPTRAVVTKRKEQSQREITYTGFQEARAVFAPEGRGEEKGSQISGHFPG